jgi:hypothetical protein
MRTTGNEQTSNTPLASRSRQSAPRVNASARGDGRMDQTEWPRASDVLILCVNQSTSAHEI